MSRHTGQKVSGRGVAGQLAVVLGLALLTTCDAPSTGEEAPAVEPGARALALGVDVLLRDSLHLLAGKRMGLITNHTGVSWPGPAESATDTTAEPVGEAVVERAAIREGVSTIDRLAASPAVELVALYSPEHGIRGRAQAGQAVASGVDPSTGLPIHSLYGETRRPSPDMLEGIDVLVFDIQDIGARYYTYVWTMALAMEAAGELGIEFVVLDRPNPLGGERVQGNVLDPEFATFVGLYPVPMRHGLTVGELARMLVGELGVDADLTVVPMDGWSRSMWYVQTGLPFIPPSPNMPSVASAAHYPGTCLFEGTNLSVGRGTDAPFQWIGAPWLDADSVTARLNAMVGGRASVPAGARSGEDTGTPLAGFYVEATRFRPEDPGDGKYAGQQVHAVRLHMTDPRHYDPTLAAVAALTMIREIHSDELEWNVAHFDRLAGTSALRQGILSGQSLQELTADWPQQRTSFMRRREPYLLYR